MPHRKTTLTAIAALGASLLLTTTPASAATFEWDIDADGDWKTDSNWSGPAGEYPDDSGDVAELTFEITGDRTITVFSGGETINRLNAGDPNASHTYVVDGGPLTLTGTNGNTGIQVLSDATLRMDTDLTIDTNTMGIIGDGSGSGETLVMNGRMERTKSFHEVVVQSGLTLVVNTTQSTDLQAQSGGTIAAGFDGLLDDEARIRIGDGGTLSPHQVSRTISDEVFFGDDGSAFDGGGNELEVTGSVTIESVDGRNTPKNMLTVEDGTLAMGGNVNWNVENTGKPGRNWITLDNGTIEVRGTGNTYTVENNADIDLRGIGTLALNNTTGSATGTGNTLILASGITLAGDGQTDSAVNLNGGTIAPGNSIGTLDLGDVTSNDGTFNFELATNGDSDTLNVGDLNLSGTGDTLNLLGDANTNKTYTLVNYTGTLNGVFDNINFGNTGFTMDDINYGDDAITITSFVIPEPLSAGLVLIGGLTLLARRRRRTA